MKKKKVKTLLTEKELFGGKLCVRVDVNVSELNQKYNYVVVNVVGNCLDSDLCTIRVRKGDNYLFTRYL